MRVNFVTKSFRHKSAVTIQSKDKSKKTLYKYMPKQNNLIDKIQENIIPTEELCLYFKFPERLSRRNTISTSKIYKRQRTNFLRSRSGTVRYKTKTRNAFTILHTNKSEYAEITAEKMHQNLNEDFSLENNEERVNYLLNLNPFYEKFHSIERHSEAIIRTISPEYKGMVYPGSQVIFRYGSEATDFYLIHKGKVNLYFPFTENMYMNIDEYYIYLLRLRRYGEIEMLNNVLLMNNNAYMRAVDDPFSFDDYILKLYNTFIKIKFSPVFLNQKDNKKYHGNSSGYNKVNNPKKKIYISEKEFNDNIYETFTDKEMKNLVLRIENELTETIKWVRPEELRQIVKEEMEGEVVKKIVKIPEYLVMKFKTLNPDELKKDNYISRIQPIKIFNTNLPRQKIHIMKYLYIKTISKGEYFGEFTNDTNTLFHSRLLNTMKHSKLNLKIHQHDYFHNMTAISVRDNSDPLGGYLYLGLIERGTYMQYFRRFIEKITYSKKKFILNNRLFKNCKNDNLIKTYSNCFQLKTLKEHDTLISEKNILTEDNTFIYFIIKGEFRSICNQTIQSIDKILTYLNCQEQIAETIPIKLNKIKDTFFFEEICKKELKIKLNFLTENDIVGIAENILRDKYFNSVHCVSKEGAVYYVDSRIIHIFVESDSNIRENKNLLLFNKYKVLSDTLLKQRKSYLDSFCSFQIDSVKERENAISRFTKKPHNIFHAKEKFKKLMAPFTTKNSVIKNRKKEGIIREKKYRSLSAVCELLSEVSKRTTLEEKRRERTLLFKQKYLADNERNKKYISFEMKEIGMALNILKELEFQKSNYLCFKNKNNPKLNGINSQKNMNNKLKIKYDINKNSVIENIKNNPLSIKDNFFNNEEDDKSFEANNSPPIDNIQNLTPLHYHSLWKNKNNSLVDINSLHLKNYKKNKFEINKINRIRLERKEMINKKLRNIYTTDLEKILLNDGLKKAY